MAFVWSDENGFQNAPEVGEAFWLVLGKAHWQLAQLNLNTLAHSKLIDSQRVALVADILGELALATTYFERFWKDTELLERRLRLLPQLIVHARLSARDVIEYLAEYGSEHNMDLTKLIVALSA